MTGLLKEKQKRKSQIIWRLLAVLYAITGLSILHFWYAFFYGDAFHENELRILIPNFDGYRDWEQAFVIPDLVLAVGLFISVFLLWTDKAPGRGRMLATACAGAGLFLGLLDVTYGYSSGFYDIDHSFVTEVFISGHAFAAQAAVSLIVLLGFGARKP